MGRGEEEVERGRGERSRRERRSDWPWRIKGRDDKWKQSEWEKNRSLMEVEVQKRGT